MRKNKTLLILGNGANLHMGYKTKWTDYWNWRREQIIRNNISAINNSSKITDQDIDKAITNLRQTLQSFDKTFRDTLCDKIKYKFDVLKNCFHIKYVIQYYPNNLEPINQSDDRTDVKDKNNRKEMDELFDKYLMFDILFGLNNDSLTFFNLDGILSSDKMFVCFRFFEEIYNGIRSIDALSTYQYHKNENKFHIESWCDVEEFMKHTILVEEQFDKDMSNDYSQNDLYTVFMRVMCELKVYGELGERLNNVTLFENDFKKYILSLKYCDDKYNDLVVSLIFQNILPSSTSSIDVLDFNYEDICSIAKNNFEKFGFDAIFENIFQPHGNVSGDIVIGGNMSSVSNLDREVEHKLGKANRKLALKYTNPITSWNGVTVYDKTLNAPYLIDLQEYDSLIVYGWSFSESDFYVFKKYPHFMDVGNNIIDTKVFIYDIAEELTVRHNVLTLLRYTGLKQGKQLVYSDANLPSYD